MTTERRFANLDDATVGRIYDALSEVISIVIKDRAEILLGQGLTRDEVNEHLKAYVPRVNQWRADTLRIIEHFLDEPFAPTHELH